MTDYPQTIRRRVITRFGDNFRSCTEVQTHPLRSLADHEVLIRNSYAGVNGFYDKQMCLNNVAHMDLDLPFGTGVEAVGTVVAVGAGVNSARVGEAVSTVCVGQGYCDYQIIDHQQAISVPEASAQVLALIPTGVSALVALEQVAELKGNEVVAVAAAGGGLGHIVAQLALLAGNHVIGICGADHKARALREIGLQRVINYRVENLAEVLELEYKDSLDIAFDSVGGSVYDAFLPQLAPHGRLIISGYASEVPRPQPVMQPRVSASLYWKAASVRGFMNMLFPEHAPDARRRLLKLLAGEKLQVFCEPDRFNGLNQIPDAVEFMLSGQNLGKVVVNLNDSGTE